MFSHVRGQVKRTINCGFLSVWKLLETFDIILVHNSTKYITKVWLFLDIVRTCYILYFYYLFIFIYFIFILIGWFPCTEHKTLFLYLLSCSRPRFWPKWSEHIHVICDAFLFVWIFLVWKETKTMGKSLQVYKLIICFGPEQTYYMW